MWFSFLFAGRSSPPPARRKPVSTRLVVEALEDRLAPSSFASSDLGCDRLFQPVPPPASIAAWDIAHNQGVSHGRYAAERPFAGQGAGSFTSAENDFFATGDATHLGAFTHFGRLSLTPTDDPAVFTISGRTTYKAANGDELYAVLNGTLNAATGVATGIDTWDGGTGRFAHASGTAAITAQLLPDGSFTFNLSGVIAY